MVERFGTHLRNCPKHRKPLPCVHCAMVTKTVTVSCSGDCGASISMPASGVSPDFTYTCANCTPDDKRAAATGVPRSEITPEIKNKIEESLATVPTNPPTLETTEVETSNKDVATIKADGDPDDAADITDRSKEPRKSGTAARRVVQRSSVPRVGNDTKIPRYLKTVPMPVVPSTNPQAPFGYDENDRPIGVPVPKPSMVPTNIPKSNTPAKPHKFSESNIQVGGLSPGGHNGGRLERFVQVISEPEAELRRLFGERIPADTTIILKPSRRHYEFVDYVKMFQLTRTDLVELLNTQIYTERIENVLDTTQPKQKLLKSPATIKSEANSAETRIADANKRIAEIGEEIKESEKLIDSWSVTVMKAQVKRGERQPDDILDRATCEKFKYEERQKIDRLKEERSGLRQRLNTDGKLLTELRERIDTWGLRDEDYEEQYPRVVREYPILFRDKFIPPDRDEFKGILPPGYGYGADGYAQIVHEVGGEYRTSGEDKLFRHWRQFENELVLQVIGWGLIQPSPALLKKHPTLTTYIDRDAAAMTAEPEAESADNAENALILKTGGAQIGGQVYSAGTRWNGRQRSLSSFDGPIGRGSRESVGGTGDDYTLDASTDNSDSYQPD
jgi:hypothetical protein